jgi:hypothetical protein
MSNFQSNIKLIVSVRFIKHHAMQTYVGEAVRPARSILNLRPR